MELVLYGAMILQSFGLCSAGCRGLYSNGSLARIRNLGVDAGSRANAPDEAGARGVP